MKIFTRSELQEILRKHAFLIKGEEGGEYADLRYANLRYANLRNVNLRNADLRNADLKYANLEYADLRNADLRGANLRNVNLRNANLRNADLRGANLEYADLRNANLKYANLEYANLRGALNLPFIPMACPDSGSFIGWKLAFDANFDDKVILKLFIPSSAKRSSATTRKCRCNKAKVLEIQNIEGDKLKLKNAKSAYNRNFEYKVGEMVSVPNFDEDRWNECSTGIHFFINRQEAVNYGDS